MLDDSCDNCCCSSLHRKLLHSCCCCCICCICCCRCCCGSSCSSSTVVVSVSVSWCVCVCVWRVCVVCVCVGFVVVELEKTENTTNSEWTENRTQKPVQRSQKIINECSRTRNTTEWRIKTERKQRTNERARHDWTTERYESYPALTELDF